MNRRERISQGWFAPPPRRVRRRYSFGGVALGATVLVLGVPLWLPIVASPLVIARFLWMSVSSTQSPSFAMDAKEGSRIFLAFICCIVGAALLREFKRGVQSDNNARRFAQEAVATWAKVESSVFVPAGNLKGDQPKQLITYAFDWRGQTIRNTFNAFDSRLVKRAEDDELLVLLHPQRPEENLPAEKCAFEPVGVR